MYYPLVIRASSSFVPKANTASKEANAGKDNTAKVLPSSGNPFKEAELPKVIKKEVGNTREVALDVSQPPTALEDASKEKEAPHNM